LLIPLALVPVVLDLRRGAGGARAPGSIEPGSIDRWLLLQSLPVLALFIGQAAWKQAYANWALPAAFTLGVWLVIVLMRRKAWRSLCAWLISSLLLTAFIGHGASVLQYLLAASLAPDSRPGSSWQASAAWLDRIDPFRRQRGWDNWVEQLRALEKPPQFAWAVRDRDSAARIRHAFPGSTLVYLSEPGALAKHHYAIQYAPERRDRFHDASQARDGLQRAPAHREAIEPTRSGAGFEGADAAPCAWVVERGKATTDNAVRPPASLVAGLTRPRLGGVVEAWTVREVACATR
jgi:hypothetical protein